MWLLVLVALFAVPSVCHAHTIPVWFVAGWMTFSVLLIPLLIALLEGSFLMWCFKTKWWKTVKIMFLANFVLFGLRLTWLLVRGSFPIVLPTDTQLQWYLFLTWGMSFALALLVKWFFCWWALGKQNKLKALLAALLLNLLTCTLLAYWYAW